MRRALSMGFVFLLVAGSLAVLAPAPPASAAGQISVYMSGLQFPIALGFASDGRIFYAERNTGNIRIIQGGLLLVAPYITLPNTSTAGERGLLGDDGMGRIVSGKFPDRLGGLPESDGDELDLSGAVAVKQVGAPITDDAMDRGQDLRQKELTISLRVLGSRPTVPDASDHRAPLPRRLLTRKKRPSGTGA